MKLNVQEVDLAIIGGGLVGASLARALGGAGLRTLILDQQPAEELYTASLDNRGLALSYGSAQILQNLQVWDKLSAVANMIKTVHVSEQGCFGFSTLAAEKFKLPALGYVLSASALGAALIQGLEDLPDITVLRPVTIKQLDYDSIAANWTITLDNCKIKAKLLIAADGTNSFLRTRVNIPIKAVDYQQSALVTNISLQQTHQNIAYERFTADGVLALLPFGERQVKCVLTTANTQLENFNGMTDAEFLQQIQTSFGFRLGKFVTVAKRQTFSLQHLQACKLYSDGVILLGNAANTLHPVAAQGFNLGLRDVMALKKILTSTDLEVNDPLLLQEYAAQRSKDHQSTQRYTNSLVNIFSSNQPLIRLSRRLGLLATQFIPALNKRVIAQGLGAWTS